MTIKKKKDYYILETNSISFTIGQKLIINEERYYMRDRIIQVATEKINKYGFRKFTVNDIATELGISKKTVYKYFTSKNEIISVIVDTNVEMERKDVLKALESEGSWTDKLQALMFTFVTDRLEWVTEELHRFFPQEWAKIEAQRKWKLTLVKELFVKAIENGEIRSDIAPGIIELTFVSTVNALFNYDNLEQIDMTPEQAMEEFKKILFTGILTKKVQDVVKSGNVDNFVFYP